MSWLFPNRNSTRQYLHQRVAELASSLTPEARVLDAGAGIGLYRHLFAHTRYESADFCQVDKRYGHIDHVCDLKNIPIASESFDAILCTQVLEHLPEPAAVLAELARLLVPGGRLVLSAPLYYEEHEQPYDFFRYTRFGLKHLIDQTGLSLESIECLEGYYGSLAHQLKRAKRWLPLRPRDYGGGLIGIIAAATSLLLKPACAVLARWFNWLDMRHPYNEQGHCMNYILIATKRAGESALPNAA